MSTSHKDSSAPSKRRNPSVASQAQSFEPKSAKKTPMACTFCRGRKMKCDGLRPSCRRCDKRNIPCMYTPVSGMIGDKKSPGTISLLLASNSPNPPLAASGHPKSRTASVFLRRHPRCFQSRLDPAIRELLEQSIRRASRGRHESAQCNADKTTDIS